MLEAALAKAKKIKEQGITKDQILQRIEELQTQILENERKLYPESALALEEKERVRTENSQLYTELEAYRQALAELIKQQVQQEPVDAVAVRKDLVETQAKLACAEKRAKAEKEKFARFHEAVKDTLPDRATELRWLGTGPKLFTEKVKRVLHDFTP
jgi:deoxyribodipyrimidine photolyase